MSDSRKLEGLKSWAKDLKKEVRTLYLAYRHPATPGYVKLWALLVVAYAVSPIDLIPDFIPVIGYLDDLLLLPIGIWLAIKLIPPEILAECRKTAEQPLQLSSQMKWTAVTIIAFIWGTVIFSVGFLVYHHWFNNVH